jgi:hypothetical protein
MASSLTSPTPAMALLHLLNPVNSQHQSPPPTDAMADEAMTDFLADITALDRQHNKGKTLTDDQLAEQVFGHSGVFKDEKAFVPHARYHLRLALQEFARLDAEMKSRNGGSTTMADLQRFKEIIGDYLFDLRDIASFLQRNVPGYVFFKGGQNPGVSSWEAYRLACGLAYQSSFTGQGGPFDHKMAQIASVFALRQALELRFERLISVYPSDKKGKSPKLRHGFHLDFIVANKQFFQTNGFEIRRLRHLYGWCNDIVHKAYQPNAWQIAFALRQGGLLLQSTKAPASQNLSIYDSVEIIDVEAMQTAYENHFLAHYGHGTWQMTRGQPEALMTNWRPGMAFTGKDYRPVLNRPSFWNRIISLLKRR